MRINGTITEKVSNSKGNLSGKVTVGNANISVQKELDELKELINIRTNGGKYFSFLFASYGYADTSFPKTLDLRKLDTSTATNMRNMFSNCNTIVSLDLSGWDTSNVTTMFEMFRLCANLTSLDLSTWDVSNVTIMGYMFYGCDSLASLDLSTWDTQKVTAFTNMFRGVPAECQIYVGPNWTLTEEETGFAGTFIRE